MLLATVLIDSPVFASEDQGGALSTAVNLCASLSDGQDDILELLEKNGWSQSSDRYDTANLLASVVFSTNHSFDSNEALERSLANAYFMSGSILGNSSLKNEQPTFTSGEITLGVIGLNMDEPGLPYCAMSGPTDIFSTIKEEIELEPILSRNSVTALPPLQGSIGTSEIMIFRTDTLRLTTAASDLSFQDFPFMQNADLDEILQGLKPVNIVISPKPLDQVD